MLFAFDHNNNRIYIDDTQRNGEYFCPYCEAPMITKKGKVRQRHFAHKANHFCSDMWERMKSYDISPWHNEWQACFPRDNQEVKLSFGDATHRADVLMGRTVVEFHHEILPVEVFDDRNEFYLSLNYRVAWLFDLTDIVNSGNLTHYHAEDGIQFSWRHSKRAFEGYDVKNNCIDLFFQISDDDSACIVRVTDVSAFGFRSFKWSNPMSKKEFLEYIAFADGDCPSYDSTDTESNESYLRFREKYNINLSEQQERAVQSVKGAFLLLAVPGSGKTTVLVDRLGYMVEGIGIDPCSILAITFSKSAAIEMRSRYIGKFGGESVSQIDFRTINSLSYKIYTRYCEMNNETIRQVIQNNKLKSLLKKVYREYQQDKFPSEADISDLQTAIAYAKNMMLTEEQISEIDSDYPNFSLMFKRYCDLLEEQNQMDLDDQMIFAHRILTSISSESEYWQNRYRYICVDEAQDTSKIQHEIIRMIAHGNNVFMVGDEDQTIYGFRAAYPEALLNFQADYNNSNILRMERNYRSTPQIVELAQRHISGNEERYNKTMVADRDDGKQVELITVNSLEEQYLWVLSVAKSAEKETAFLYRHNESSIVLADVLLRNNIGFCLKKPDVNFFMNSVVQDMVAYLTLAINPYDTKSLERICNRGLIYLKKENLNEVINYCADKKSTVFDALESCCERNRILKFIRTYKELSGRNTEVAIRFISEHGYEDYLVKNKKESCKIETLLILAKREQNISKYLKRLEELEKLISEGFDDPENIITLSTIHSSKGKEYDTVYMVDVYDGRFPSSKKSIVRKSKDGNSDEQEERRLFYVGITRAKNELYLFNIVEKQSRYIDSLFPEAIKQRLEQYRNQKQCEVARQASELRSGVFADNKKKVPEVSEITAEYVDDLKFYHEVKDLFTQQDVQIRDSRGVRWVKCEICGQILPSDAFVSYGGPNHFNLGKCNACGKNHH